MKSTKNIEQAFWQYDLDLKKFTNNRKPELAAASRLRRTWGADGAFPGHCGVQPGAVFTHRAELTLLGLHGSIDYSPEVKPESALFWARNDQLLAICLDLNTDDHTLLPDEGPGWCQKKAESALWIQGTAGTYEGVPVAQHRDKGSAGLLASAQLSGQPIRIIRGFNVRLRAGAPTRWWIYAGLFKVVNSAPWIPVLETRHFKLDGVDGEHLTHQELLDRVSKVNKGTPRGVDVLAAADPASPLSPRSRAAAWTSNATAGRPRPGMLFSDMPSGRAPAAAAAQRPRGAANDPPARAGGTSSPKGKMPQAPPSAAATGVQRPQRPAAAVVGTGAMGQKLFRLQPMAKGGAAGQGDGAGTGQGKRGLVTEEQGQASKKPKVAHNTSTEEKDIIKAWQVGLTGRPHVIRMDLTRSNRLPVPVFKEPRPDHLGPDAQAEQDAQAELEFEYVHDYKWEDGVLKEVWPVLMHEENVMRKTAAELRKRTVDQAGSTGGSEPSPWGLGGPAGVLVSTANTPDAWWTAGPKKPMCGTLLHAHFQGQRGGPGGQVLNEDMVGMFDAQGCVTSTSHPLPVLHQCHQGCHEHVPACTLNQQLLEGPTLPLEVFRAYTPAADSALDYTVSTLLEDVHVHQGHWGVRCHMPIRKGRFVCCLLGQLTSMARIRDVVPDPHVMHVGHVRAMWQRALRQSQLTGQTQPADLPAPPTSSPYGNCKAFWQAFVNRESFWKASEAGLQGDDLAQKASEQLAQVWKDCTGEDDGNNAAGPPSLLALDTRTHGNVSRLIRHSFRPNLRLQIVYAGSCRSACLYYMALIAAEDIPAGTELTYDHTQTLWLQKPTAGNTQPNR